LILHKQSQGLHNICAYFVSDCGDFFGELVQNVHDVFAEKNDRLILALVIFEMPEKLSAVAQDLSAK